MITAVAVHRGMELGTRLGNTFERIGPELVTIVDALDKRGDGQAVRVSDEVVHDQSPLSLRNLVKPVGLR